MSLPDANERIKDEEITASHSSESSGHSTAGSESSQVVLCSSPEEIDLPVPLVGDMEEVGSPKIKEYYFGFGTCRPKWLQVLRSSKFFTFILCLNCAIEGALVSGFTSVVLSTIERRYRFSSVWAGLIASCFDMTVLVSVLFISYFGGRGHKPRWLGISLIIQGAGSFVFSLPQFLFGPYETLTNGTETAEVCQAEVDFSSDCNSANSFALALFFIGNIVIGVGAAPLFTIGTSYLDDIISPKYVTIHLGIFYAFSVVGPAIGYGLGGVFLSIYVDPWESTQLEPSHPRWVGAWWMSFIFSGIVSWLFAIPFLMFPRLLPDSSQVKAERVKEMAQKYKGKDEGLEEVDLAVKVRSFPQHIKQVLKTPSWLFITIAICFSSIVVSGVASFAPKYVESQFGLTASAASLIAGGVAIPSGGVGVFIGGLIVFFTKSKGKNVALINWIVTLIALLPTLIFLVHCPTLELAGVTVEYPDGSLVQSSTAPLNGSCIANCDCRSTRFEPICGQDGYTYFSPCTAGCRSGKDTEFSNCLCISDRLEQENRTLQVNETLASATEGKCDQGCDRLGLFLAIVFVDLLLIFVLQVPNVIITIRSVADEQRTLALGAQSLLFRAFGTIPGPIIFGAIFDSTCLYWQYDCSRRGNCWVYNNTHLSERAVSLAMGGIATNFIFSFLSWLFYPKASQESSFSPVVVDDTGTELSETSFQPTKRSARRMDSHCSEDGLLDSGM